MWKIFLGGGTRINNLCMQYEEYRRDCPWVMVEALEYTFI